MIVEYDQVSNDIRDEVDVAVIGSGCGGATAAKVLAEGGLSVALLERGGYYTTARRDFDQREDDMMARLDGGRGLTAGSDGQIALTYGNCVGGASVHYWADSWRTPSWRSAQWERMGVTDHCQEEVAPYFDIIERDLNIHPAGDEYFNEMARTFDQGASRLGWKTSRVMQARKGCVASGHCMQGCSYDAKMSQLVTHIPAALEAGAKIYADCEAMHIMTEGGRATGVTGRFLDRRRCRPNGYSLHLRSRVVILAAGGYGSAVILLRDRLANSSGLVGQRLYLNPVTSVFGIFDKEILLWTNIPAATGVKQFMQVTDDNGYQEGGFILHPNQLQPATLAALLPGFGHSHRDLMELAAHIGSTTAWIDDENPGRIALKPGGAPLYEYSVRGRDRLKVRDSLKKEALVLLAAGARECILPDRVGTRVRDEAELDKIDSLDISAGSMVFPGPHPAGTLPMGTDPGRSVVGSDHQCHDLKGLYVTDPSVFPRAVGTDPSLTIMAWSHLAADRLLEGWPV